MTERPTSKRPRKVLLLEINEITWTLIDPLLAQGKLPAFADFIRHGTKGSPLATEDHPNLDPWIAWTTIYTGRPQEEHGVHILEQPPETVTGPRIWEIAADAGKSIGIFGSIMSWPPRPNVKGFWIPGTFSPSAETYPLDLQPIQDLNLTQTRAHTPLAIGKKHPSAWQRAWRLRRLGLSLPSMVRAASFLLRTRWQEHRKWEKVSLQPVINGDFFAQLYRRHRPDFATFHTNHVAHYQHRFWRSMDPGPFKVKPTAEEVYKFGQAIEHGYKVTDQVLCRFWGLVDKDTVVIVASGLGQKPYVVDAYPDGRAILRIRDVNRIMQLCGLTGGCTPTSMMANQWNLRIPDASARARAERILGSAYVDTPDVRLFGFDTQGDVVVFNPKTPRHLDLNATCVFPDAGQRTFRLGELCATEDDTPKEGYHDPVGMIMLRGPGIRQGGQLDDCTNLDLAPTMLHLLGLPIPAYMRGRVLAEALDGPTRIAVGADLRREPAAAL